MYLLLLVNGNGEKILEAHGFNSSDFEVIKIYEKQLAKPKEILKHIRKPYKSVYFGCIDIEFQRFPIFMIFYILLSKPKKGGIIDEMGNLVRFSFFRVFLITPIHLFLEILVSIIIVLYSYINYYLWWKKIVKD
ncbi:MAG: hypothetical protein ACUVQ1_07815 [Candidatus Kapaibacteriales bacterium]